METPTIKPRRKGRSGMQAMLIPSPRMVAEAITAAPEGMVTELGALGRSLAARYRADACCPVTVRRHLRTIAEDAFENVKRGEAIAKVTPFWRVVDPASLFARRLAGGEQFIRERQAGER